MLARYELLREPKWVIWLLNAANLGCSVRFRPIQGAATSHPHLPDAKARHSWKILFLHEGLSGVPRQTDPASKSRWNLEHQRCRRNGSELDRPYQWMHGQVDLSTRTSGDDFALREWPSKHRINSLRAAEFHSCHVAHTLQPATMVFTVISRQRGSATKFMRCVRASWGAPPVQTSSGAAAERQCDPLVTAWEHQKRYVRGRHTGPLTRLKRAGPMKIDPAALSARKGVRGPRGMHYLAHKNLGLDND